MKYVNIVGEGVLDLAVASKLVNAAGHEVGRSYDRRGKNRIDQNLTGYNAAAVYENWFVLRDMDNVAHCAVSLRFKLLANGSKAPLMQLRIVKRAIEAWLLADSSSLAALFGISVTVVRSIDPRSAVDPKRALIDFARRSRFKAIRDALVPRDGSGRSIGPEYNLVLQEFVATAWNPSAAASTHDGVSRAMRRLEEWVVK